MKTTARMITLQMLEIYRHYNGDIDAWVRSHGQHADLLISDKTWGQIDSIFQDINIVKNGLASPDYRLSLLKRIETECDLAAGIELKNQLSEQK